MKLDFYDAKCQSAGIDLQLFGICDDEDGKKAYVDSDQDNKWIATVLNSRQLPITFTAIDNCIEILRDNGEMENRCDGMLTYPDNIVFIELKNQRTGGWIGDGLDQIETTIIHFKANHKLNDIKYKRAFVANKRKIYFHVLDTERKRRFFDKYRVRIHVGGDIKIA
ncbi:hypothetical protein [Sphingobacterium kyonggiense]